MPRTKSRPIPSGRMGVGTAYAIFILSTITGLIFSYLSGVLTLSVALTALFIYNFVYTPLKSRTEFAMFVGAVVGALPPVAGYLAVNHEFSADALLISAFIYFYQIPHTLSLNIMFFDDWKKAGFKSLAYTLPREKLRYLIIFTGLITYVLGVFLSFRFAGVYVSLFIILISALAFARILKNSDFEVNPNKKAKRIFVELNLFAMSVLLLVVLSAGL